MVLGFTRNPKITGTQSRGCLRYRPPFGQPLAALDSEGASSLSSDLPVTSRNGSFVKTDFVAQLREPPPKDHPHVRGIRHLFYARCWTSACVASDRIVCEHRRACHYESG